MALIKGYKFSTEAEVDTAQNDCNVYYGIPAEPEDVTQNWTGYSFAPLNTPTFWFIIFDDSLIPILGQPEEFQVETNLP
jgi:hypothetical protein